MQISLLARWTLHYILILNIKLLELRTINIRKCKPAVALVQYKYSDQARTALYHRECAVNSLHLITLQQQCNNGYKAFTQYYIALDLGDPLYE